MRSTEPETMPVDLSSWPERLTAIKAQPPIEDADLAQAWSQLYCQRMADALLIIWQRFADETLMLSSSLAMAIQDLLASHWQNLQKMPRQIQTLITHASFTDMLIEMAQAIEPQQLTQLLMPGIVCESVHDKYPDLVIDSGKSWQHLLDTGIVSDNGLYWIPVKLLTAHQPDLEQLHIQFWHPYYHYELPNPDNQAEIAEAEMNRLWQHSSLTQQLLVAWTDYVQERLNPTTLYGQLTILMEKLKENSVGHHGTELRAGEPVYDAINDFKTYYDRFVRIRPDSIPTAVQQAVFNLFTEASPERKGPVDDDGSVSRCISLRRREIFQAVTAHQQALTSSLIERCAETVNETIDLLENSLQTPLTDTSPPTSLEWRQLLSHTPAKTLLDIQIHYPHLCQVLGEYLLVDLPAWHVSLGWERLQICLPCLQPLLDQQKSARAVFLSWIKQLSPSEWLWVQPILGKNLRLQQLNEILSDPSLPSEHKASLLLSYRHLDCKRLERMLGDHLEQWLSFLCKLPTVSQQRELLEWMATLPYKQRHSLLAKAKNSLGDMALQLEDARLGQGGTGSYLQSNPMFAIALQLYQAENSPPTQGVRNLLSRFFLGTETKSISTHNQRV